MTIIGLHHAQITIPRGAEMQARQFYCHLLGLPEIAKPASLEGRGGFWLQVGDRQVHMGSEDGIAGVYASINTVGSVYALPKNMLMQALVSTKKPQQRDKRNSR